MRRMDFYLPGLRSLCTILWLCIYSIAEKMHFITCALSSSVKPLPEAFLCLIKSVKGPPFINSMARKICPLISLNWIPKRLRAYVSILTCLKVTILLCLRLCRRSASDLSSSMLSLQRVLRLITFKAISWFLRLSRALYTVQKAPWPRML